MPPEQLPVAEGVVVAKVKGGWAAAWVRTQGRTVIEEEILSSGPEGRGVAMERMKLALAKRILLAKT